VTIHPFEDGNGRIARAIADMTLARSEQSAQRFYSMSAQIRNERNVYFDGLEATPKGALDVTEHLEWFLDCLGRAFDEVKDRLAAVIGKARFWRFFAAQPFNDRQRLIINKLLDGPEGKLTSSKWAKLAKCSQDTALRDIQDLVERGVLKKGTAGGRSTSYSLVERENRSHRFLPALSFQQLRFSNWTFFGTKIPPGTLLLVIPLAMCIYVVISRDGGAPARSYRSRRPKML
jgi:Fic family protein